MMSWQTNQPPENLFIFKTNIKSKENIAEINHVFRAHQSVKDWWVDIEDIDKVMRVEVKENVTQEEIIAIVKESNFFCEQL